MLELTIENWGGKACCAKRRLRKGKARNLKTEQLFLRDPVEGRISLSQAGGRGLGEEEKGGLRVRPSRPPTGRENFLLEGDLGPQSN